MKDWTYTAALVILGLLLAWNFRQDCDRWKLSQDYFTQAHRESTIVDELIHLVKGLQNAVGQRR